jgi:hypothetical protein
MPIDKAKKIGMAFGLRPLTQINYSLDELKVLPTGDTLYNNYIGQGGLNQAYIGFGKSWKNISIGFNTGYNFGKKKIENIKSFQYNSDSTHFYQTEYSLSFGGTYTLDQNLHGKQDILRQTGTFSTGSESPIDTASLSANNFGIIKIPSSLTAGIALHKKEVSNNGSFDQWVVAIEFDKSNWKDKYSFYGQPDLVSNAYMTRVGFQYTPNVLDFENYWSTVTYRAGFNIGKDYINIDQKGLDVSAISLGFGLPIRKYRSYDYQFSVLNLALQFGKRGSSSNSYQESYFQFTAGYSLSDIWFNKRKYD